MHNLLRFLKKKIARDTTKTPEPIIQLCEKIIQGSKSIQSPQQLKKFLLLAVNRGLANYDQRDEIARYVVEATIADKTGELVLSAAQEKLVDSAYAQFCTLEYTYQLGKNEAEDRLISDLLWKKLKETIEGIKWASKET